MNTKRKEPDGDAHALLKAWFIAFALLATAACVVAVCSMASRENLALLPARGGV